MRQSIQKILWLLFAIFLTVSFSADAGKRYGNFGGNKCCNQKSYSGYTKKTNKINKKKNVYKSVARSNKKPENSNIESGNEQISNSHNSRQEGIGTRAQLAKETGWSDHKKLKKHFEKHGADFNAVDEKDYATKANSFYKNSNFKKVRKKIDSSGKVRIWDSNTNEFGTYTPDGKTITYYKPDPSLHKKGTNEDYWRLQEGDEIE